jgi:hypothetical protein
MSTFLIHDGQTEVCVVRVPTNEVTPPTDAERSVLTAFFAEPANCSPDGQPFLLDGVDIEGVNGPVVTYRVRPHRIG